MQSFGKYQVSELLGSGGMAEVYAGIHPELNRRVAIKVILPQFATEDNFEERFRREARLVASLRHAHIVQIYDFDVVDGRYFMVMEYLEGGTLKEKLAALHKKNARLALPQIANILDAMAAALDYAHGRGAVHRDIKPANILFTTEQEPVLTDFGIAKLLEDASRLTATGGVLGSPFYMAPEQASGGAVDAASDQYALGVVLYEMATGRVPFLGASAVAVMTQHANTTPPAPRTFNAELPAAVETVLFKVLAKRPAARFASTGELAQAFRDAVEGRGSGVVIPVTAVADDARTLLSHAPTLANVDDVTQVENTPQAPAAEVESPLVVQPQAALVKQPPTDPEPMEPPVNAPAVAARDIQDDLARPSSVPASAPPASAPKPATQNFNVGGIQAGIVNQGGEQNFSGNLTFNLDFGNIQAPAAQPEKPTVSSAEKGDDPELIAILESLRRAFAGSGRVDRFVRLVTQFHNQLGALPADRAADRKQVVKRVQALLMEMTEAKPDPDMVGIMGASLERAVQPLAVIDPELSTMATRITSWVDLMVQPE